MRTLEEIALERLKRRKDYEKRNGKVLSLEVT